MVDFKLLLNPPIARKVDFLRRRCVQEHRDFSNFACTRSCSQERALEISSQENSDKYVPVPLISHYLTLGYNFKTISDVAHWFIQLISLTNRYVDVTTGLQHGTVYNYLNKHKVTSLLLSTMYIVYCWFYYARLC